MSGWFGFNNPQDLLAKLERELAQLERNPSDADTAFNFFITAWSLVDWLGLKNKKLLRQNHPIIAACAHLADGSKHFCLTDKSHTTLDGTARGIDWAKRPFGMNPGQRPVSATALFVHLEGRTAKHFGRFPSALEAGGARRPLEREWVCLDCGLRTPQFKHTLLGIRDE